MTTVTTTCAAQVAAIHIDSINASRKRAGLAALTLVEAEREFADADRAPLRKTVAQRSSTNQAATEMWSGIVARHNASLPSNPAPITAGRTLPESSAGDGRIVDWSAISADLNREARAASAPCSEIEPGLAAGLQSPRAERAAAVPGRRAGSAAGVGFSFHHRPPRFSTLKAL